MLNFLNLFQSNEFTSQIIFCQEAEQKIGKRIEIQGDGQKIKMSLNDKNRSYYVLKSNCF